VASLLDSVLDTVRGVAEVVAPSGLQRFDQYRTDGWVNNLTGLGTDRDKTRGGYFCEGRWLTDPELSNLYTYDDLSGTIVDTFPQEEFRLGFGLKGLEPENATEVDRYLRKFNIVQNFLDARIWGRLYGGAVIWIMTTDGAEPEEALDLASIKTVLGLKVIDRRWCIPIHYYTDGPQTGMPDLYRIQEPHPGGVGATLGVVHESRLIRFGGERTETINKIKRLGWDMSVLVKPFEALRASGETWKAIELLVSDANQGVYKVSRLYEKIAGDLAQGDPSDGNPTGGGSFLKRVQIMDRVKSVFRAIVLDKDEEDYTRQTQTFTGLPDLSDRAWGRVAAASKIPVPILRGENPAGLNATGTMQLTWFWAKVDQNRTQIDEPLLLAAIKILLSAQDAPAVKLDDADDGATEPDADDAETDPIKTDSDLLANIPGASLRITPGANADLEDSPIDKIGIVWPPLWAPTATELADIRLKRAQEAQVWIIAQALLPEEAILSVPEDWWTFDRDMRKQSLKEDAATMLKQKNTAKLAQGEASIAGAVAAKKTAENPPDPVALPPAGSPAKGPPKPFGT